MPKTTRPAKPKRKTEAAPSPAPRPVQPTTQSGPFPIVGIGGSAGGYEAFVQLLQSLPADTGMAFVFVMHLEPEHPSMLAKLLGNVTPMPVTEARNGQLVEPNHVYVIPPKADIAIREGVLEMLVRRKIEGRFLPVDKFLSSLAEDRHDKSIGVILSGTGSDGTMGVQAIKAEGGITFAQDEESAKHYGMPGNAIATDCVDFVLSPDQIGKELHRLAHHPYVGVPQGARPVEVAPVGARAAPEFSPLGYERIPHTLPAHEEPIFDAPKEADRLIWQRFSHAGLVLNDNLDILHFRGDTSPFVSPSSGKASLNALRIVNDELKTELRSAIHRARRTNSAVRASGVRLKYNGGAREINLEVEPLIRPGSTERYFLVLFDDPQRAAELAPPAETVSKPRRASREQSREIEQLRRELDAALEYAQSVVEQQEASSEELKSANKEILSSNEELQSTNKELKTAKEELQSTNEELVTLNETMQNRNLELSKLTDDLSNVLDGADVPILIVGDDGRIRRFTRSAERHLNLLPTDVGRPIGNIRPNVDVSDLDSIVNQVSHTFAELEREVRDNNGRWYSLRIRPYRTADNKIDGALMAFLDIDAQKRTNQALGESEAMMRALVETLIWAILVVDESGKIVMLNAAAENMFGYQREQLIGRALEDLLPERLRDKYAAYRSQFFQAPRVRLMGEGLTIVGQRNGGAEFPAEVSLSYIRTSKGLLAVAFVTDLTKQREVEKELAAKESALRLSEQQLQTLTGNLLTAQEEEKARLADDLHDDLNQRLAALALQAADLEKQLPDSPTGLREKVSGFRHNVEVLADEVRRLAQQLHPSVLEHFGLAKALGAYCEEFASTRNLRVRYRHRNVADGIAAEIALCLYRVAQESLTNIAKHSGAKVVSVVLVGSADNIHLTVDDDGVGFDPASAAAQFGLGLISMRERLRQVGGRFSIKARPSGGTRVDVVAPLVQNTV